MKKLIAIIVIVILVILGIYFFLFSSSDDTFTREREDDESGEEAQDGEEDGERDERDDGDRRHGGETVLGSSVEDRDINAFHYGSGGTELLFVGGIHGGYSWNTSLVAYELMDYLEDNPDVIPDNLFVTVVPVLNPDGLNEVVGTSGRFTRADVPSGVDTVPGRFNANNVDLNRNFDCDWQSDAVWQARSVSGGTSPFSEPESRAVRDYVMENRPDAVVVWYSAAGGVFASNCHEGVLSETSDITGVYANASGYPAFEEFDFYEVTGDMVNWLAKENIPGISVLLSNHSDVEWEQNRRGVEALFEYYAE